MSKVVIAKGSIFQSNVEVVVNPVNCVGVAGAGLAKEFKKRYAFAHSTYSQACDNGEVEIGKVLFIPTERVAGPKHIACLPTKRHWAEKSNLTYVNDGLLGLRDGLSELNAKSVAIPALGCGLGGLDFGEVLRLIHYYFDDFDCDIVEVYPPRRNFGTWNPEVMR